MQRLKCDLFNRFAVLCLIVLFSGISIRAQVNTASLSGQVVDATGAAAPGVKVTAKNLATNIEQTVMTDNGGSYIFVSLPVGAYTITVELTGFKKSLHENLKLEVAQKARLDIAMQVGGVSDTVNITSSAPLLSTQEASVGSVVENKLVTDLPLSARNWDDLLLTVAGVQGDRYTEEGGGTASGRTGNVNVNGVRSLQNNFILDGADNNSISENVQELTTQIIRPSVEAIQEFKVITNAYSADYGRSPGAAIIVNTKAGTNQFHGSLYEFHRNRTFDANNFFLNRLGREKPQHIQNQFGGSLGGPVIKDRFFFFGNYEGTRIRKGQFRLTNVPLANERIGDFSPEAAAKNRVTYKTIYDPTTARVVKGPDGKDQIVMSPFPGNKIPQERIDPVAKRIMGLIPTANITPGSGPLNANNYLITPNLHDNTDSYTSRVDYQMNPNHNLFIRYSYTDRFRYVPGFFGGVIDGTSTSAWGRLSMIAHQSVIGVNSTLSSRLVNEFRLSWGRNASSGVQDPYGQNTLAEYGIKGIPDNPMFGGGLPGIAISGGGIPSPGAPARLGSPTFLPKWQFTNQFQWADTVNFTTGNHQLKFGTDFRGPLRNIYLDMPALRGEMEFNGQFTGNGKPADGNGYADFLLGYVRGAQESVFGQVDQRLWMWSQFIQDDWKISPKVTLNLGLRYDFATWPYEASNRMANVDLKTGQLIYAKEGGLEDRTLIKSDKNNFAPRIGIAWSLNEKTVIRTGYGRFYQLFERYGSEDQLSLSPPFLLNASQNTSSASTPIFLLKDGFPLSYRDPKSIDLRRIRLRAVNPDSVMPEVDQWNFGIQRTLPADMVLTMDYVGTKGTHLSILRNPNFVLGGSRPYSQWGDIQRRENAANSSYNGLNATLEKRFSRGLSLRAAYTWSKSIDVAGNPLTSGGSNAVQDPLNFLALRGLSDHDYRQRFVSAVVYDTPFNSSDSRFIKYAFGGWRVSGIFTRRSGRPFSVGASDNNSFVGSSASAQANRIKDGRLEGDEQTIDRWFDTSAFSKPPALGNAGRGILIGPSLTNIDLSLSRSFNFTERQRMEFRWEIFNATNTAQFGLPERNVNSSTNGKITTLAGDPRVMQFALKYIF